MAQKLGLVYVYSRPTKKTATKINDWISDVSGKRLQKTKVGSTNDKIRPLYSHKIGGLANYISYTPWKEDGKVVKDKSTGLDLKLQDKFEKEFNLESGFLTNRPWRKGDSLKSSDMTYFQKKSWTLNDGCTIFDLSNFDDLMGYYVMLDSKFVANSERELLSNKWPFATHYIALENENEEIKYKRTQSKSMAFARLHDADFTPSAKRKFISILNLSSATTVLTDEQVHNILYSYIESSNFRPGNNIEKFNDLFEKLKTKDGKDYIYAAYLLKKAVDARIIVEKQDTYTWVRPQGAVELGVSTKEAREFLMNPKKASFVEELEEAINKKLA